MSLITWGDGNWWIKPNPLGVYGRFSILRLSTPFLQTIPLNPFCQERFLIKTSKNTSNQALEFIYPKCSEKVKNGYYGLQFKILIFGCSHFLDLILKSNLFWTEIGAVETFGLNLQVYCNRKDKFCNLLKFYLKHVKFTSCLKSNKYKSLLFTSYLVISLI